MKYGTKLQAAGQIVLRYGLVLILVWRGGMKFTAFEAAAIQPLVATSRLMSWLYRFLGIQEVSNLLGIGEISAAMMIASRLVSATLAAAGSAMAVAMFFTTLSYLFTLPGWEPALGGFERGRVSRQGSHLAGSHALVFGRSSERNGCRTRSESAKSFL